MHNRDIHFYLSMEIEAGKTVLNGLCFMNRNEIIVAIRSIEEEASDTEKEREREMEAMRVSA